MKEMLFPEKMLNKWNEELDAILLSHDVEAFKTFYQKWMVRGIYNIPIPNSDVVIRAAMEKALFNRSTMPEAEKRKAETWLVSHGFTTEL